MDRIPYISPAQIQSTNTTSTTKEARDDVYAVFKKTGAAPTTYVLCPSSLAQRKRSGPVIAAPQRISEFVTTVSSPHNEQDHHDGHAAVDMMTALKEDNATNLSCDDEYAHLNPDNFAFPIRVCSTNEHDHTYACLTKPSANAPHSHMRGTHPIDCTPTTTAVKFNSLKKNTPPPCRRASDPLPEAPIEPPKKISKDIHNKRYRPLTPTDEDRSQPIPHTTICKAYSPSSPDNGIIPSVEGKRSSGGGPRMSGGTAELLHGGALGQQCWFHGLISRKEAETRLKKMIDEFEARYQNWDGVYLVREKVAGAAYVISVARKTAVNTFLCEHHLIEANTNSKQRGTVINGKVHLPALPTVVSVVRALGRVHTVVLAVTNRDTMLCKMPCLRQ